MDFEKKIWVASAVLFLTVGMVALGHAVWLVGTGLTILLDGLFVARGFLPVLNIRALHVGSFNGLGLEVSFFFMMPLAILQKNNPHAHVPLFILTCAASYFCVLMMVRPLPTDFGVLHGLCYLIVFLASEKFGTGWRTWLGSTLCTLMVILRVIMEMRSEVHVAAKRD